MARFIGNPGMNVLPLRNGEGFWGFRPHAVKTCTSGNAGEITVTGKVCAKEFLGEGILYTVETSSTRISVIVPDDGFQLGEQFTGYVPNERLYFFDRNEIRYSAPENETELNPVAGSYAS